MRLLNLIRPNPYFLFFILLILNSCGTLESGRRTIFINNDDKVTKFAIDDNEYETPVFLSLNRNRKHIFKLSDNDNFKYRCHFDFRNSILPNSIFLLAGVPGLIITGPLLLTDWISGGLYNCKEDINLDYHQIESSEKIVPRRILLIAPSVSDPETKEKILKYWRKKIFKKYKRESDILINFEEGMNVLISEGVNIQENNPPLKWPRLQLNRVGEKTQFTHIIYFHVTRREKSISVRSHLYSQLYKIIESKSDLSTLMVINKFDSKIKDYFWRFFKFLPNSIAANMIDSPQVSPTNTFENAIEEHPDSFPKYLRYLTLESTLNYDLYRNWQGGFFFAPSFNADSWSIKGHNFDEVNSEYYVHTQTLQFLYGPYFFWKTPYGTSSVGINGGASYLDSSSNLSVNEKHWGFIWNVNIRYQYNFTRRFYIAYDARLTHIPKIRLNNAKTEIDQYTTYTLRLGFFLPQLENWMKNLFY